MTNPPTEAKGGAKLPAEVLEQMARAADAEEAAQKGEPTPWLFAIGGNDEEWKSERRFAMQAAWDAGPGPGLVEALKQAVSWFTDYEQQHLAKTPPDFTKAVMNRERADALRTALAPFSKVGQEQEERG